MSSLDAMATERRLVEQFLVALRALPGVSAELEPCQRDGGRPERELDAQVVLTVAGKPVTLLIEVKKGSSTLVTFDRSYGGSRSSAVGCPRHLARPRLCLC